GGYLEYLANTTSSNIPITSMYCNNAVGFKLDTKDPNPYFFNGLLSSYGQGWGFPVADTARLYIKTGVWTGEEWIVYTCYDMSSTNILDPEYPAYYFAIDPIQGKIRRIGTGVACKEVIPNTMAYNPLNKQIYGVQDNLFYSMSLTDTNISFIDTLKNNGSPAKFLNALACSPQGVLYGIDINHVFYRISSKGECTEIGNTKVASGTSLIGAEAACFDPRDGSLYWNNGHGNMLSIKRFVYKIDTNTGLAQAISTLSIPSIKAFFLHYYTKNTPPGEVVDFDLEVDSENPLKVKITGKMPLLNFNGETQRENLSKLYLCKHLPNSMEWQRIDSMDAPTPGSNFAISYVEATPGVYEYGIRIKDQQGLWSNLKESRKAYCYRVVVPYLMGFEEGDVNGSVSSEPLDAVIDPQYLWHRSDSNARTGKYAYYRCPNPGNEYSVLKFNHLPVKKGGTYCFGFYYRLGNEGFPSGMELTVYVNGKKIGGTEVIAAGDHTWHVFPAKNKNISWQALSNTHVDIEIRARFKYSFYVDDVSFLPLDSAYRYPDTLKVISVSPLVDGSSNVKLKWKNPAVECSGDSLGNHYGVIVQAVSSTTISSKYAKIYKTDTLYDRKVGAIDSMFMEVPIELLPAMKKCYFRFTAFNDYGQTPYVQHSKFSDWIGIDSVPNNPDSLRATVVEGKAIKIDWTQSQTGSHGGYLGTNIHNWKVTYYEDQTPNAEKISTQVNTPTFTTPSNLKLSAYIFEVRAISDKNPENIGGYSSIASVSVDLNHQVLIANLGRSIFAGPQPFWMNKTVSSKNPWTSTIAQSVYTKEQMGGPRVIDSLYFYFKNTAKNYSIPYTIYVDYKTNNPTIINAEDWTSYRRSTTKEIFRDTLTVLKGIGLVAIPVRPFFYDGSSSLVFTIIRHYSFCEDQINTYANNDLDGNYTVGRWRQKDSDDDFNFDTIGDISDITPQKYATEYQPAMSIHEVGNFAEIQGIVKSLRSREILHGATISIVPLRAGSLDIKTSFLNDSISGTFSFNRLLGNIEYQVRISALGYADSSLTLSLSGGESQFLEIYLDDAQKIKMQGKVVDRKQRPVVGASVQIKGVEIKNVLSSEQGEFSFENIYGNTSYELNIEKESFQLYHTNIVVEKADTNVGSIILKYNPYSVFNVKAVKQDQNTLVTWTKPISGTHNEKWAYFCQDSSNQSFNISFATEIKAAVRFSPEDRKVKGVYGKGLKSVCVRLVEFTADYTLSVYQGSNAEEMLYTRHLGDKYTKGWYTINFPSLVALDSTKDIWISLSVKPGYDGYPMPLDEGPNVKEYSSMVYSDGDWLDIRQFNKNFNYNIAIKGVFADPSEVEAPFGYSIYRGNTYQEGQSIDPEQVADWTKLNAEAIFAEKWEDSAIERLPVGAYVYKVQADYGDTISPAAYSNFIYKDLFFKVKFLFTDTLQESILTLTNADGRAEHVYRKTSQEGEDIEMSPIWKGNYTLKAARPYYQPYVYSFSLGKDTVLNIPALVENITDPQITSTQIYNNECKMDYTYFGKESFYDNFESYSNFTLEAVGPFIFSKPVQKGSIKDVVYPNSTKPQSWIVFNPSKTNPVLSNSGNMMPMKGESKYLLAMYAVGQANNDYLIYPLASENGGNLSFCANGIGYGGVKEKMVVLYSSTNTDTNSFLPLHETSSLEVLPAWKEYAFIVPQGAKYIAIRYISQDLFGLMIDKFSFSSNTQGRAQSFDIYLDGNKISKVAASNLSYTFKGLSVGKHKVGIRAIFNTGSSNLIEKEIDFLSSEKTHNLLQEIRLYP
ncbi:MAG: carboxypeptidase regulatory-like domain-containing protein, partial [Bacteroidales bacterium]